ncbi:MAG TPA: hypothetical protein VI357_06180 [Mycobacteriales bacterium]
MSEPTGNYYAPGQGPMPGQPGYGEPIPSPWAPASPASYEPTGQQYAPPAYGTPRYGTGQYGTAQYGAPQNGAGPYGQQWQQFHYGPPAPRPSGATVITAAVIQIVQASLFVLGALAILLVADVVNNAGDEFDRQSGSDISGTTDTLSRWVAVAGVLLLAAAVFMIVLAALAIRGRRWAAITSVVLQGLTAVTGLVGLARSDSGDAPGISVVFLLASIAVVVLFLLPTSTAYFTAKAAGR